MESIPTDSINQLYRHQPFKKLEMKELGLFPALTEFLHFFFFFNELLQSCQLLPEKHDCVCLRQTAFPCVFQEASCLSKLDLTHSKGKNSPDYTEKV